MAVDNVRLLDMERVDPPSDGIRDLIDPDKIRELADSIRSCGLLQPILVRRVDNRFEVVAGHRRFLAHKMLGEVKIKAIVRELAEDEVILIRAIENDQREDLNPLEKARVYQKLRDRFGWSDKKIGTKMGRAGTTVAKYLEILEYPEDIQREVGKGTISMQVAHELNKVDDPEFRNYYFKAAVENGITLDVAIAWVSDYKKTKAAAYAGEEGGRGVLGASAETLPIFQACVCCFGSVEVNKVRYIPVCPTCESKVKGSFKPGLNK